MSSSSALIPHSFIVDHLGDYAGFTEQRSGLAWFTFEVASEIARDYAMLATQEGEPPRQALYEADADTFRFFDPALEEWLTWEGKNMGRIRLYPIGDGAWTWRPVGGDIGDVKSGSVGE